MKKGIDGKKVEAIRILHDKSKTDMASIIGCRDRSYDNKIKGATPFQVSEVIALMEHFNIKFEDLL